MASMIVVNKFWEIIIFFMKKKLSFLIIFTLILHTQLLCFYSFAYGEETSSPDLGITAKSAILMEASTGKIIYEKNSTEHLSPASITKIMTLILIFDSLSNNKISLEDIVTTSEYAASMGGSQVFLEAGEQQTVETLIKCIIVSSGNDASVCMAEYLAGSESEFVNQMNTRAAGLGMNDTHFLDCCGLTDSSDHYTSAKDVAIMSKELITKYPQIHNYSTIWMENITHTTRRGSSEFGLANTNKLLKQYQWATGLKTGSTSIAKYCLSATASKDGVDLIAVIMAAPDYKARFAEAITLLNYGYSNCSLYTDNNPIALEPISIKEGVQDTINCEYEKTFSYLITDGEKEDDIQKEIVYKENLTAPIAKGDVVGELIYSINGTEIGRISILSGSDVRKANYLDYLKKALKKFL